MVRHLHSNEDLRRFPQTGKTESPSSDSVRSRSCWHTSRTTTFRLHDRRSLGICCFDPRQRGSEHCFINSLMVVRARTFKSHQFSTFVHVFTFTFSHFFNFAGTHVYVPRLLENVAHARPQNVRQDALVPSPSCLKRVEGHTGGSRLTTTVHSCPFRWGGCGWPK